MSKKQRIKNHHMKRILYTTACIILVSISAIACKVQVLNSTGLTKATELSILRSYAKSLDSLACYVPFIGADTESVWAKDEAHNFCSYIYDNDVTFNEGMARIYRIQSLISYGMSYQSSIYAMYSDDADNAAYAFHSGHVSDSLFTCAQNANFARTKEYKDLASLSFFHLQLYPKLYNTLNGEFFNLSLFGFSLRAAAMMQVMEESGLYSEKELLQLHLILESVSFFHAYTPMMNFSYEDALHAAVPKIIEMGQYFDKYATPVTGGYDSKTKLPTLSDSEFEEYMVKVTEYKVFLINTIATAIARIEKDNMN